MSEKEVKIFIDVFLARMTGRDGTAGLELDKSKKFVWVCMDRLRDMRVEFLYFEYGGKVLFDYKDASNTKKSLTRFTLVRYRDDGSISLPWSDDYETW